MKRRPEHYGGRWLQEQLSSIETQQQAGLEPEPLNSEQIEDALQKALAKQELGGALALSIRLRQSLSDASAQRWLRLLGKDLVLAGLSAEVGQHSVSQSKSVRAPYPL